LTDKVVGNVFGNDFVTLTFATVPLSHSSPYKVRIRTFFWGGRVPKFGRVSTPKGTWINPAFEGCSRDQHRNCQGGRH